MRIDVSGINALARDLTAAGPKAFVPAARVTEKAARDIERDAKAFAPVDTGNLRSSISTDVTVTGRSVLAEIGPTASYGEYVELGTSRMAPHAYLGPAFDRYAGSWADALDEVARAALGR